VYISSSLFLYISTRNRPVNDATRTQTERELIVAPESQPRERKYSTAAAVQRDLYKTLCELVPPYFFDGRGNAKSL
jgi:hypothetical protein